ncbi:undecaprenyldiphospho-muramoylpentapeptide beta-N-acetylglucosaminyltransferase [Pseudohoeflea coraliihabitans]|uniref:UDP-N-acetylglucosamine--N-acetylmuramyl-(pentapeptide) pyrophosphoryl-undecaprenol N-acetylglucosamine transferase n=1 Tax=Pseudohoeflea coraliihabitans TaxID=2860393 RepID=A0ABS6WKF1_9HYPH|nr:undecaprenyldiphospho-muramoylpentapeptide beta-N-acetylglucosaminyltransferase [Pseudohoeflea sp. DP4N28-3]
MGRGPILLAAGGTGGHLFPAEALAGELAARGHRVELVTDMRAEKFAGDFPAERIHLVPSATFGGKSPLRLLKTGSTLAHGFFKAWSLMRAVQPKIVVGFGGYPTVPPLMAAALSGQRTIIHEQNGVMGRANRALAGRVDAIAGGFLKARGRHAEKIVEVGNPARPAVLARAGTPYERPQEGGPLRLLVFGGSQGAQFFSAAVPEAIAQLPAALQQRLVVTQQARGEDEERLTARYAQMSVQADVARFFDDLPAHLANAHLVLSRSGASTVNELAIIGRPAILVPLPHALDDDQGHNAQLLVEADAALMRRQPAITRDTLAADLTALLSDPERLYSMAANAHGVARVDATRLLADLVEAIAAGKSVAAARSEQT